MRSAQAHFRVQLNFDDIRTVSAVVLSTVMTPEQPSTSPAIDESPDFNSLYGVSAAASAALRLLLK